MESIRKKVQVKDIPDLLALAAVERFQKTPVGGAAWPYDVIMQTITNCPFKVAYRKLEQLEQRGLTEVGVSLRAAWLTDEGKALLAELRKP